MRMKLHHIGKVVADLAAAREEYRACFGLEPLGEAVVDPIMKVEVQMLGLGLGAEAVLELIHPVDPASPVQRFLDRNGGGLHHLAWAVADLAPAREHLLAQGALALGPPVPGKGHEDRMTQWFYTASRELVELVEVDA